MTYSLRSKDSSGKVVFDARYSNHVLDQSGTASCLRNDYTESHNPYRVVISLTARAIPPLIAWQPPTDRFGIFAGYHKVDGLATGQFDGAAFVSWGDGSEAVGAVIPWRSYVPFTPASDNTYGLRFFDENNQITFDSGHQNHLKIKEVFNVNVGNNYSDYVDVTHTTINPYYIFAPTGYLCVRPGVMWAYGHMGLKKLSATSVRLGWSLIYFFESGGAVFIENPQYKLLVIEP